MKHFTIVILLTTIVLVSGCTSSSQPSNAPVVSTGKTHIPDKPPTPTKPTNLQKIQDLNSGNINLQYYIWGDRIYGNFSRAAYFHHIIVGDIVTINTGLLGTIVVPNKILSSGSIDTLMISGGTLHHTAFSIKIPSTLVGWGVVYGAASGTLKEVFIDPEGYDSPLAPQGVSVAIAKNPSPTLCSPYDMEHFDEQYYTDLKKQGRFFTVKKTIAGKLVDVTYQKKYYETLFNGWVARYCISDNDMTYGVAIALYERKELDAIVASFRLK